MTCGTIILYMRNRICLIICEVAYMTISYNGLWKILIDKNKKKTDLIEEIGISSSTLAKMSKGKPVSLVILAKICDKYECDFGDLISYEK